MPAAAGKKDFEFPDGKNYGFIAVMGFFEVCRWANAVGRDCWDVLLSFSVNQILRLMLQPLTGSYTIEKLFL